MMALFAYLCLGVTFGVVIVARDGEVEDRSIGLHSSTWKPSADGSSSGAVPALAVDASRRTIRSVPFAP